MTLVNANSIFEYEDFSYLVMDIFDTLTDKYRNAINKKLSESGDGTGLQDPSAREMETYNVFKDFF